jgi:SAM-dependent methyltransferase
MLMYAPGMVSRELRAVSKSIIGADISTGSVEAYNRRAAELGAPPEEMRAIAFDLIKDGPAPLGDAKFDVVVVRLFPPYVHRGTRASTNAASQCSMAYHHFDRPEDFTRALAALLSPGGTLFVIDFAGEHPLHSKMAENMTNALAGAVPHVHGFTSDQVRAMYEGAGLGAFAMHHVARMPAPMPEAAAAQLTDEERMISVFLAEGKKV